MAQRNRNFTAQQIANMKRDEVWNLPMGGLMITYDDGEVVKCKTTATIFSWYYWQLNLKNKAPIKSTHFIGNDHYKANTHVTMLSTVLWDSYYEGKQQKVDMFWKLSKIAYEEVTNKMYNDAITFLDEEHSSVDLSDVMDIALHPVVLEIKKRFSDSEIDEVKAHEEIFTFMTSDHPDMRHNQIAHSVCCDLVDKRQIAQIIGPRANIADISGDVFPHIIEPGYANGLRTLYDQGIESRTASVSLYAQGANLEDSEYTNRQCQLLCSVIRSVDYTPCKGSTTMDWNVVKEDRKLLLGINHMVGKTVTRITHANFDELVGTTIKLRTLFGCGNGKPHQPCIDCVGQNGISLPPGANFGHHAIAETLAKLSQLILSTKHVIANAMISYLNLQAEAVPFVKLGAGKRKDEVYVKRAKTRGWKLRLPREGIGQLPMIRNVPLDKLSIERVSSLVDMTFVRYVDGQLTEAERVPLKLAGKGSPLSLDALEHLRDKGWDNHPDFIEIDLNEWDCSKPIVRTLPRGRDVTQTLNNFNSFMMFPAKDSDLGAKITDFTSVEAAVQFLAGILQATLPVNLITIQVMVRSLMAETDSYRIPSDGEEFRYVSGINAIKNRNTGNGFAYQGQPELILNAGTYLGKTKETLMPAPMDALW